MLWVTVPRAHAVLPIVAVAPDAVAQLAGFTPGDRAIAVAIHERKDLGRLGGSHFLGRDPAVAIGVEPRHHSGARHLGHPARALHHACLDAGTMEGGKLVSGHLTVGVRIGQRELCGAKGIGFFGCHLTIAIAVDLGKEIWPKKAGPICLCAILGCHCKCCQGNNPAGGKNRSKHMFSSCHRRLLSVHAAGRRQSRTGNMTLALGGQTGPGACRITWADRLGGRTAALLSFDLGTGAADGSVAAARSGNTAIA
ncbi:MAG: hypothetical protein AAGE13_11375 [Pseudomonadota bacterium]